MFKLRILWAALASFAVALAGCTIHHPDIQQGNFLDEKNVSKLSEGMKKNEVRFLMGSPMITDPFQQNRWDYVYSYEVVNEERKLGRVTLYFENETVARIEKQDIKTIPLD